MPDAVQQAVILDDYQGAALAAGDWSSLLPQVRVDAMRGHLSSPEELSRLAGDAAILIAIRERMPLTAAHFAQLPRLRLLVTFGMANASIDIDAAGRRGIVVCGTRGTGNPTVEMTWALVLALLRNVPGEAAAFASGASWQRTVGTGLQGKTIGLVGLGRVGRGVARVAAAFGMTVLARTPSLTHQRASEAGAELASSLEDLMARSDIVSLHLPLSRATRHLVGREQIALMKPGAYLVNTARGPVVDEKALIDALVSRRIAGAAADVFDIEPLPRDHPLRSLDNFIGTPHVGYVTRENFAAHAADAIEDIAGWLAGRPVRRIDV